MDDFRKAAESEIIQKLHPHTLSHLSIKGEGFVVELDAKHLLTHKRFDLIAKYIYAKYRDLDVDSNWYVQLYDDHIFVFNDYREGDGTEKLGINEFIDAFDRVLDSVKDRGFDENISLVPVGNDYVLIDGAHRVAACLFFQKKISALLVDKTANVYDYHYFLDKGLKRQWLDVLVLEYCLLKKNTYIVTVFPAARGRDGEIRSVLSQFGQIYSEKSVNLRNQAPLLLMKQMYASENWLGDWRNNFKGAQTKANACFSQAGPVRVFVFETDNPDDVKTAKSEIRGLFGIGNHSVHINDSHQDTVKLAQIFFNHNSIHFLNHAQPVHYRWFYHLLYRYENWLEEQELNKEHFCVDGSAVMALYGVREARDLDFLHYGDGEISTGEPTIDSHNHEVVYYPTTRDDIIFNPENHFYYEGLKFASIQMIRDLKKNRGETKDLVDLKLLEPFLRDPNSQKHKRFWNVRKPRYNRYYLKAKIKRFIPSSLLSLYRGVKKKFQGLYPNQKNLGG